MMIKEITLPTRDFVTWSATASERYPPYKSEVHATTPATHTPSKLAGQRPLVSPRQEPQVTPHRCILDAHFVTDAAAPVRFGSSASAQQTFGYSCSTTECAPG